MAGKHPDHDVQLPLNYQGWSPTAFLHYPCDAQKLAQLLPDGLTPDLFDGQAWISLTPLLMYRIRPAGVPALPGWSTFPELNIRTYVRGPDGHDGIWFFRLDCPRRLLVWALNILGLPYNYREAEFEQAPREVRFRFHGKHKHDLRLQIGAPLAVHSARDIFLTGRWNAFGTQLNRLIRFPVAHQPWPLHSATASGSMLTAPRDLGLPVLSDQPIVQYSPGVNARFAAPRLARW